MAYEQRAILEELFGRDRLYNVPRTLQHHKYSESSSNLYDSRICKSFLVGSCPHDLFSGTKEDMGRCKKQHLEKFKIQYESDKKKYEKSYDSLSNEEKRRISKMIDDFEYDYMKDLQYHINQISRKVSFAKENLEHTPEEQLKIDQISKDLDNLDIKIGLLTQEIELLVKNNETMKSLKLSNKLNELLVEREKFSSTVREITDKIGQANQQQLEVCLVCGAYLSRLDSDRRLADHFTGKIHLGYVIMRSELRELENKRQKK